MKRTSHRRGKPNDLAGTSIRTHGFANPEQAAGNIKKSAALQFILTPISELNLMIKMGYGDTPQVDLPADWRMRKNGDVR